MDLGGFILWRPRHPQPTALWIPRDPQDECRVCCTSVGERVVLRFGVGRGQVNEVVRGRIAPTGSPCPSTATVPHRSSAAMSAPGTSPAPS